MRLGIVLTLFFVGILGSALVINAQDLPINIVPNEQIIEAGSYLIPLDNEKQSTDLFDTLYSVPFSGFNLAAYGLVYELLENDIPVQWIIKSGKSHQDIDVSAESHQVFPTVGPQDEWDYRSSLFVVKLEDLTVTDDCFLSPDPNVEQIIEAFGRDVKVFQLDEDVEMDVRYELNREPISAVLSDGPTDGDPHFTLFDEAGIPYELLTSEDFFEEYSCYTFISQPHLATIENDEYIPSLNDFLADGGNFFAHCVSVASFEKAGEYVTTDGLRAAESENETYSFSNDDMPIMQFEGNVLPTLLGGLVSFELDPDSEWRPEGYIGIENQDDDYVLSGGDVNGAKAGGNIFYISGHEINSECFEGYLDDQDPTPSQSDFRKIQQFKRTFLNAAFVPADINYVCAGEDKCICPGDSVVLGCDDVSEDEATVYTWSPSDYLSCTNCPNPVASPPSTMTYTVSSSDDCSVSEVIVGVREYEGVLEISGGGNHCGEGVSLIVEYSGSPIDDDSEFGLYYNGDLEGVYELDDESAVIEVFPAGDYTVEFLEGDLCTIENTGTAEVMVGVEFNVNLGPDQSFCDGAEIELSITANPDAEIEWQDGSSATDFTTEEPGEYWVYVEYDGCEASDTVNLSLIDESDIDLGNDVLACFGETVTLDAGYEEVEWQDGFVGRFYEVTEDGVFTANYMGDLCPSEDEVEVSFITLALDLGPDINICEGDTARLEINPVQDAGVEITWQDGSDESEFITAEEGIYWVELELEDCTLRDSVTVSFLPASFINLGPDQQACSGEVITLDAAYADVEWQDESVGQFHEVTSTGTYIATYAGALCNSADTIFIEFIDLVVDLGADIELCEGDTATFSVSPPEGVNVVWQNASTDTSFSTTAEGQYWVRLEYLDCEVSDTINFTYAPASNFDLGDAQEACLGDIVTLDAFYEDIIWQDSSIGQFHDATNTGMFTATYIGELCPSVDSVFIEFIDVIIDLGPDRGICEGDSILLDLSINVDADVLWQDGSTAQEFYASAPIQYWATASYNDCFSTDSLLLGFLPQSLIELGPDTSDCIGATIILDAGYEDVVWQDGMKGQFYEAKETDLYTATYDGNLCPSYDEVDVSFTEFELDLGEDPEVCEGETVVFEVDLGEGAVIQWQDGTLATNITVADSGLYWVDVRFQGCQKIDSIRLHFIPETDVNLGEDKWECEGETITLDAGYEAVVWQDGSTGQFLEVEDPGVYQAIYNGELCGSEDEVEVEFIAAPLPPDLGPDLLFCKEVAANIGILPFPEYQYEWNTGDTTSVINIDEPGTYLLSVTNICGTRVDEIKVETELGEVGNDWYQVPSAFSPNGDGLHDEFKPVPMLDDSPQFYHFQVFNRWGNLIFESKDPDIGWDGLDEGTEGPVGVFLWMVTTEFEFCGEIKTYFDHGNVTLIR